MRFAQSPLRRAAARSSYAGSVLLLATACGASDDGSTLTRGAIRFDAGSSPGAGDDAGDPLDAATEPPDAEAPRPHDAGACPSHPTIDPLRALRNACAFQKGDHAATTLGLTPTARAAIPIKHVIVVMKENRSFDHIFGGLKALQPAVDVADGSFENKDSSGVAVPFFHESSTCVAFDADHGWAAMHAGVNGGKMNGFVTSAEPMGWGNGHYAMGHYDRADLPFYYFLASTFAIADRYFPSVQSATFPNRDYLLLGTSDGVTNTERDIWPSPLLPSIFDELGHAGVSWAVYADDFPFEGCLDNPLSDWSTAEPWGPVTKFFSDVENDALASVSFIDGRANVEDEHPTGDLQVGEAWTKRIYDAVRASKAWDSTALLFTYDEAGGFADHVPPSTAACIARPQDSAFFELGVRVPLLVVSPWARRHYVSHLPKEHTSITRFVEALFDLPALTARDANSDALLDMFDFDCAPADVPVAPAAGKKGCGAGTWLKLDKTTYTHGEPISVSFGGAPGNPNDTIGIYPKGATPPASPTLWSYSNGHGHTGVATGKKSGTVSIGPASANAPGSWPLPAEHWTARYQVGGGSAVAAFVEFDVTN